MTRRARSAEDSEPKPKPPRDGVAAPRRRAKKGQAGTAPPTGDTAESALREAAARFGRLGESLTQALAEVPRPADFEPLAEHLYELARQAPALRASLDELPKVAGPLMDSVQAVRAVADALQQASHGFSEALMRLPRAEDYEPLAQPLREFTRVSPALAEALREVLSVATPLAGMATPLSEAVRGLAHIAARLEDTGRRLGEAGGFRPAEARPVGMSGRLVDATHLVEMAHESVLEALAGLPRSSDYEPVAAQLRAIASVSPSLMDWLGEVPAVAAPLAESVRSLQKAAADLKAARELLHDAVANPEDGPITAAKR